MRYIGGITKAEIHRDYVDWFELTIENLEKEKQDIDKRLEYLRKQLEDNKDYSPTD